MGKYSDTSAGFVQHAAILSREVALPKDAPVEVWHIGPPLVVGDVSRATAGKNPVCRADLASDVSLTISDRHKIANWLAKVDKERRPRQLFRQYVVSPHVRWDRSEVGRGVYRRFSCVGVVIEAYAAASIRILDLDAVFPLADETMLNAAYPDLARVEGAPLTVQAKLGYKDREDLGLSGPDSWRIILPGYIFHALQRANAANPRPEPYAPKDAREARFP